MVEGEGGEIRDDGIVDDKTSIVGRKGAGEGAGSAASAGFVVVVPQALGDVVLVGVVVNGGWKLHDGDAVAVTELVLLRRLHPTPKKRERD